MYMYRCKGYLEGSKVQVGRVLQQELKLRLAEVVSYQAGLVGVELDQLVGCWKPSRAS